MRHKNKSILLSILLVVLTFMMMIQSIVAYTEDPKITILRERAEKEKEEKHEIQDRNILLQFMGVEALYPKNTGFLLDISGKQTRYAEDANTAVLNSIDKDKGVATEKKYSLYDLYGPDLSFFRYMGEVTAPIELADHIYSAYEQNKLDKLKLGDTIFYKPNSYLSCRVYGGRPPVLSNRDISLGKKDPRVEVKATNLGRGYSYSAGSFYMTTAKHILSMTSFLIGPKPIEAIDGTLDTIFSVDIFGKVLKPLFFALMAFAMLGFILTFGRMVAQYFNGNNIQFAGKGGLLARIGIFFLCMILATGIIANPGAMKKGIKSALTIVDSFFANTLNQALIGDEVVSSTDSINTTEAALWRKTIFEPWCIAQFGRPYEQLYTQFSGKPVHMRLPQSNMSDAELRKMGLGEFGYNSSKLTGDIGVHVGQGTIIKNWAALLYSCGSKYHIDQTYVMSNRVPDGMTFPAYQGMANDNHIAADVFRVVDATMDISPQLDKDGTASYNYTGARMVVNDFMGNGLDMLFRALLVAITMLPSAWVKLIALFKMLGLSLQALLYILIELMSPKNRGLATLWDAFKTQFKSFVFACLRLFVLITLYLALINGSMLRTFAYVLLAIQVYSISPNKIGTLLRNIKTRYKQYKVSVMKKKAELVKDATKTKKRK